MTSVISGNGLGLFNSSLSILGGQGSVGNANVGQGGSRVYVNGANGNLVIQRQDDILVGLGLDVGILRTYNSQGQLDGDNNDGWRIGVYKQLVLSGVANTANSTVTRTDGDGNETVYTYDTTLGSYVSTAGGGAYDTLDYRLGTWTWTDGNSRTTETYNSTGQLTQTQDADGNTVSYTYTGSLITQVYDSASNQTTYLDYTGNQLTDIRTVSDGVTQIRTRYGYDSQGRLSSVTTDLSPEDSDITDGNVFTTTYTYDGTSTRVTGISENGQQVAGFTYVQVGSDWKVQSFSDGEGRVTTLNYDVITQMVAQSATADSAALVTPTVGWLGATLPLESSATAASNPLIQFDANGNGLAVWIQGTDLMASRYDKATDSWSAAVVLDNNDNAITTPQLYVDPLGNAIATWVQSDGTANSIYANRFDVGTGSWVGTELLETGTTNAQTPWASINANGQAVVVWAQKDTGVTTVNSLYATRYSGGAWSGATLLESSSNTASTPSVAIDEQGNASAVWVQSDGTADSIYVNRFDASTNTLSGATLLESSATAASNPLIQFDASGNGLAMWIQGTDLMASRYDKATDSWSAAVVLDSNDNAITTPQLYVDASGNAIATWVQSDGSGNSIYANRFDGATGSWVGTELLETRTTAAQTPWASINANGEAVVVWAQKDTGVTTVNSLYATRYSGGAWSGATLLESSSNTASTPSVAIDEQGNASAVWVQSDGTADSIYVNRYNADPSPYYLVQSGDTWSGITLAIYGTSDANAVAALQSALGYTAQSPVPVAGTHLVVPTTIAYTALGVTGNKVTLTDVLQHQTELDFDFNDQLTGIVDGLGNALQYGYNANGDVTSVTDGNGNTTSYEYDANGNQILSRDALGNTITRTYGSNNELLTETVYLVPDPDGAGAAQPGSPVTTRYTYDAENHLRFITSPEGRVTEYRYNTAGKRTAAIQYTGAQYDLTGLTSDQSLSETQLTTWVGDINDAQSTRTDYQYDFRGNVQTATVWAALDSSGNGIDDGNQSITTYVYDQAGLLLKTIAPNTTADANDYVTQYGYDGLGRLLSTSQWISSTETRVSVTQYDDVNHRVIFTANNGLVTTSTYDNSGLLVSVAQSYDTTQFGTTQNFYDAAGRLRMTQDATGAKKYILYDSANRKVADIDSDGSLTEYVYNANGQVSQAIRYVNAVNVALLTDAQGLPANVDLATIRPASDPLDQVTRQVYDKAGRLVQTIDASGYVTQSFYDGAGRVTDVIQYANAIDLASLPANPIPDDVSALITVNSAKDRHSRSFYGNDGELLGSLDGNGYLVTYQYDAGGRQIGTTGYYTATTESLRASGTLDQLIPATDARDIHTYTLYNGKGQVAGTVDGEGYLTETVYDLIGNKSSVIRYATPVTYVAGATVASLRPASSSEDHVSQYLYNGANQLIQATSPDGTMTAYVYDNVGQLVSTTTAAGTGDSRTLTTRYDIQGRVIGELSGEGSALLTGNQTQAEIDAIWDQWGIKYSYDAAGRRITSTDQYGHTTYFYYDTDNRLVYTVNAKGEVTQNVYNALNQQSETIAYGTRISTTGLTGGLVSAAFTSLVVVDGSVDSHTHYAYDVRGKLALTTDALGYTISHGYDAFGDETTRISQIDDVKSLIETYGYDNRGQLIQTISDPSGINRITSTQYDAFGRAIQKVDGNGNVTSATYDRLGRQVTTTDVTGTRSTTYDAFSRVMTQTDALGYTATYTYDTQARSVIVTTPEGVSMTTVKNRQGETATVTDSDNNTTSYAYDKNGNLLTVTNAQGVVTTTNTYDHAGRAILTMDANGHLVSTTYDAVGRVLTRIIDPQNYVDGNGNTISNPGGLNIKTSYEYDAKGQTVSVTDANGVTTQTIYDLKGQVQTVIQDPYGLNNQTFYDYDGLGHTLTVTVWDSDNPRVTQYTYDTLGRRIEKQVDPSGLNLTTSYTYDQNGNVLTKTDANGYTTTYFYDGGNRLVYTLDALNGLSKVDYDAEGRVIQTTRYAKALSGLPANPTQSDIQAAIQPDAADQVTRMAYDRDGREIYQVDSLGGVTQKIYDNRNNVVEIIAYANAIPTTTANTQAAIQAALVPDSTRDQVSRTVYDSLNQAVYAIDSLGFVTQNQYDAGGNVIAKTQYANAITLSGNPTQIDVSTALVASSQDRTTRTVYDSANRVVYTIDALGYVKGVQYDKLNHISQSTSYAIAVNLAGNPSQADVLAALQTSSQDQTDTYYYDPAGQLIQSRDAEGFTEYYQYDALGNKVSFTNKKGAYAGDSAYTWWYQYDAAGRLIQETTPQVQVTRLTQNPDGTTTPVTTLEAIVTYMTYDGLGQVKTRTEAYGAPEARTTTYDYDALGHQTKTTFPPAGVYDAALDAANNYQGTNETITALYSQVSYDTLGNAVVNQDTAGNYSYKVYDSLNRVQYEIDADQYVTEYRYDSYGNKTAVIRYANKLDFSGHMDATQAFTSSEVQGLLGAQADHSQDRILTNSYDQLNHIVQVIEPATFTYDSSAPEGYQYFTAGKTTDTTYNAFGQAIKQSVLKNPLTNTWTDTYFYFDNKGQKTAQVDALGYLTEYQYDEVGNLTQSTEYAKAVASWDTTGYAAPTVTTPQTSPSDPAGYDRTTQYQYDRKNQKIAQIQVDVEYSTTTGALTVGTTTGNLTTTYGYDAVGNLVRTTDTTGASTYSYYDALGRSTATAEPTRLSDISAVNVNLPPLDYTPLSLDVDTTSVQSTGIYSTEYSSNANWVGESSSINLKWSSLTAWGDGGVRVSVSYTTQNAYGQTTNAAWNQSYTGADANRGVSLQWALPGAVTGIDAGQYEGLVGVNHVQVWKTVNGQEVLLFDQGGDSTSYADVLTWQKTGVAGTSVTLQYRAVGTSAWNTASVQDKGAIYWVDMSNVPNDQYEYILAYTAPGETTPYTEATGTFNVTGNSDVSSTNVVGFVSAPTIGISTTTAQSTGVYSTEYGSSANWVGGSSSINLKWSSLASWGNGGVQVAVSYTVQNAYGQTAGAVWNNSYTAADADSGVKLQWALPGTVTGVDAALYEGLVGVSRVQVWKTVNGQQVLLFDTASSVQEPRHLILRGATSGLTAIDIAGVGTRAVTALASGLYQVDISDLAAGTYSYTPVGVAGAVSGSFTVNDVSKTNQVAVSEFGGFLDVDTTSANSLGVNSNEYGSFANWSGSSSINLKWASLAGWGNGNVRVSVNYTVKNAYGQTTGAVWNNSYTAADADTGVKLQWALPGTVTNIDASLYEGLAGVSGVQVWKTVNGQEVLLYDSGSDVSMSRLEVVSLPSTASKVVFAYRPQGNTGPYLSKTMTQIGAGVFSAAYDDIASGAYEYLITATDAQGNPVDLTTLGGNALGQVAGTINIVRDGVSLPTSTSTNNTLVLTPLSQNYYDIFGNVVEHTDYANGAAIASQAGYTLAGANAVLDKTTYSFYDAHGNNIQSIDANGNSHYTSYNAQGKIAKEWQPVTDASNVTTNLTKLYTYDNVGQQIATSDLTNSYQASYNSFGEIVAKGSNNAWQEYNEYDNAGHLWLTNQKDGVPKVYLYDVQGNTTEEITSQTLDLHDGVLYPNAQSVAALSGNTQASVYTYDALGHVIGQTSPTTTLAPTTVNISATPVYTPLHLDVDTTSSYYQVAASTESGAAAVSWLGDNSSINLKWSSLAGWGDGNVRVSVNYTKLNGYGQTTGAVWNQTYNSSSANTGASIQWAQPGALINVDPSIYGGLASVDRVQVWKTVNGQEVLLFDQGGDSASNVDALTWQKTAVAGTNVLLQYRAVGTSTWNTASIQDKNVIYWADLSGLANGQYEYILTYTSPFETTPYAESTGSFNITGHSNVSSVNVSSVVSAPGLSVGTSSVQYAGLYSDETGATYAYWSGANSSIGLQWSSLAQLGDGNIHVSVNYTVVNGYNQTAGAVWDQSYTGVDADTGVSIRWAQPNQPNWTFVDASVYEGLVSVNRVQVWKTINGQDVLVFDSASNIQEPRTLMLQGATSGLTSVTIAGVGTRGATYLGGGLYQVDINDLPPGTYTYTPNGVAGAVSNTFTITGSTDSTQIVTTVPYVQPAVTITPITTETYDRWGDVLSVADPRDASWITYNRYNQLGKKVETIAPSVTSVNEQGVASTVNPTTYTYYDALGREIATKDANGNIITKRYDEVGHQVKEYHPDSGVVSYIYDIFGNKVSMTDANGHSIFYTYDKNNRLIETRYPLGAETYAYDQVGNRISVTNGDGKTTQYFYDAQGNIVRTRVPMGQEIDDSYDAMGHKTSERNGNGDYQTWTNDYFGNLLGHRDLGGAIYSYSYDHLMHLLSQTNSRGENFSYSYYEDGKLKQINDLALNSQTLYAYDAAGNRIRESYTQNGISYQDSQISYDAMGHVTQIQDLNYNLQYSYDAMGNRRRVIANYYDSNYTMQTQDYWYLYDSMNRLTLSEGALVSGQVQITTSQGIQLAYDGAGNRRIASSYQSGSLVNESYLYDENNRLLTTNKNGSQTSSRSYDSAGNLIEQITYSSPGVISERRESRYNDNGWLISQDVYDGNNTHTQKISYTQYDAVGNVLNYQVSVYTGTPYTNYYSYTYQKFDSYKEGVIAGTSSYFQAGNTTSTYDVNGNLVDVTDQFNANTHRTFINDLAGHILQKTENGQIQKYYYVNGNSIGTSGALSAADFDYNYTPVSESYPSSTPGKYVVSQGDTLESIAFSLFGDATLWYLIADANGINSDADLKVGQNLTIPNEVTNLHNDYKTFKPYAPGGIIGDTTPTLPDPPPPPAPSSSGGGGCGGLGQLLVVVVTVVVAIYAPVLLSGLGAAAPIVGAALGNLAGQLVANVVGLQHGINWKDVAVAAVTAAISPGVNTGVEGVAGQIVNAAVNNVVSQGVRIALGVQDKFDWKSVAVSAISAPITSSITKSIAQANGATVSTDGKIDTANVSNKFSMDFWSSAASSAVTQVVSHAVYGGGKFNWAQVAGDAFGNAVGNYLVDQYQANSSSQPKPDLNKDQQNAATPTVSTSKEDVPPKWAYPSGNTSSSADTASGPSQAEMLRQQEEGLTWGTLSVGTEGRQGLWGVAKSLAGAGASNATINEIKNELVAQNPDINNTNLREGMTLNYDPSGTSDSQRAAQLDLSYQAARAQRASEAEAQKQQAINTIMGTSQEGGSMILGSGPSQDSFSSYANGSDFSGVGLSGTGSQPVDTSSSSKGLGYYAGRVLDGLWGAVKGVTVEPVLQVHDLGAAALSVGYNELFRGKGQPLWEPKMYSGTYHASESGMSQSELLLRSNFITGIGMTTYDGTTALIQGRYGDLAEISGGVVGGFLIGKGTSKFGDYGVTISDINASGPGSSQRGAIGLDIVGPDVPNTTKPFSEFPTSPADMSNILGVEPKKVGLTPDGTQRIIWEPNSNTRIRFESHPEGLNAGDAGFNARHHGEHYHVEIKPDGVSWNQANKQGLIIKVKPENYSPGSGTGFLPGEKFPGQ